MKVVSVPLFLPGGTRIHRIILHIKVIKLGFNDIEWPSLAIMLDVFVNICFVSRPSWICWSSQNNKGLPVVNARNMQ